MKIVTIYKLDGDDPDWTTQIEEAFNRVIEFASELRSSTCKVPVTEARAYNRVVVNREFSRKDWRTLHDYALEVVSRAIAAAKRHPQEVADSIDQAALHLRDTMDAFDVWLASVPAEKE